MKEKCNLNFVCIYLDVSEDIPFFCQGNAVGNHNMFFNQLVSLFYYKVVFIFERAMCSLD